MGLRITIVIALLAIFSGAAIAQVQQQWTTTLGSDSLAFEYCLDMVVDGEGSIYVTGGGSSGDPSNYGILSAKIDSSGNIVWKEVFPAGGSIEERRGQGIACDTMGNAYVVGTVEAGIVTIKYDTAGHQAWAMPHYGESGHSRGRKNMGIVVDSAGNSYLCFTNTNPGQIIVLSYDPGGTLRWRWALGFGSDAGGQRIILQDGFVYAVGAVYHNSDDVDGLLMKLSVAGDTVWTRQFDHPEHNLNHFSAIDVGPDGDILVGGAILHDEDGWCPLIVRYDPDGNLLWNQRVSSNGFSDVSAVACDQWGNSYLQGTYNDAPYWRGTNFVTAKYDSAGGQIWLNTLNDMRNAYDYESDMCLDGAGNVYICCTVSLEGSQDAIVQKYSPYGDNEWRIRFNAPGQSEDFGRLLGLGPDGSGYFAGMADLDSLNPTSLDIFVAKFTEDIREDGPDIETPQRFAPVSAYPNPFNARTTISYSLRHAGELTIDIYNIIGQRVARLEAGEKQAGLHKAVWDAEGMPSGIYFAMLLLGEKAETVRMSLVK
jgi:hypothetical protein